MARERGRWWIPPPEGASRWAESNLNWSSAPSCGLLRQLTLYPSRIYQGFGPAHTVHDVVRHVSSMS